MISKSQEARNIIYSDQDALYQRNIWLSFTHFYVVPKPYVLLSWNFEKWSCMSFKCIEITQELVAV